MTDADSDEFKSQLDTFKVVETATADDVVRLIHAPIRMRSRTIMFLQVVAELETASYLPAS
jgi:hypothetical protein